VNRRLVGAVLALLATAALCRDRLKIAGNYLDIHVMKRTRTVAERVDQYGAAAQARLAPHFSAAGVPYPPKGLVLVGFKSERRLDVYATGSDGAPRFIRSYRVRAASGELGPKLREGDGQVPEGLYRIEFLNPNSLFHLALRVNYPNKRDRERARTDGRTRLGGDIMIHGNAVSIGCLAMGDEAAEDLFVLAALTGIERIRVILCPADFRRAPRPATATMPPWVPALYDELAAELAKLPLPPKL
jgi:hypothetical protein